MNCFYFFSFSGVPAITVSAKLSGSKAKTVLKMTEKGASSLVVVVMASFNITNASIMLLVDQNDFVLDVVIIRP